MAFNPFGSVPVSKKGRTNFNESHEVSGTFPLSKLCPVFFARTLPGSSWKVNVFNLTRLETLIAPAMQRVNASILWFKMPERLVFKHYKKWYSGGEDGNDNHNKPHIHLYKLGYKLLQGLNSKSLPDSDIQEVTDQIFGPGTLWNYLGLPVPLSYNSGTGVWSCLSIKSWDYDAELSNPDADFVDCMPLLGYQYLYDTMFRDQTLCDPVFIDSEEQNFRVFRPVIITCPTTGNRLYFGPSSRVSEFTGKYDYAFYSSSSDLSEGGEIIYEDFVCISQLFDRAWKKDYFTSALPTPQRGPEVTLNLLDSDTAPVTSVLSGSFSIGEPNFGLQDETASGNEVLYGKSPAPGSVDMYLDTQPLQTKVTDITGNVPATTINGTADLSGVSPITIIALRNLFKLQQFMEKNNVAGGRYIESILAHWATRVPDFTVQRPQFIRATSLPVQISEVVATANSSGVNNIVGDLGGRAKTQGNLGSVKTYTHEPSLIFGLYCVTSPGSYAGQGIPKIFQHVTRFDEPWPDFQHIGEQAVKLRELYFPFVDTDEADEDFGYQQRYSEYKFMPDRVVGDFQTSLAYWHMARMFSSSPKLNDDFVTQHLDPRIFAVQNGRPVTADFFFEATAKLKLSKYSTPKLT